MTPTHSQISDSSSVFTYALPYGGPVAMVWGVSTHSNIVMHMCETLRYFSQWGICSFFLLLITLSLAELGSAAPTSGGLYYWSFKFASPRWRRLLSWIVGCMSHFLNYDGRKPDHPTAM